MLSDFHIVTGTHADCISEISLSITTLSVNGGLWHSRKASSCSTRLGTCSLLGIVQSAHRGRDGKERVLIRSSRPNAIKERMRDGVLSRVKPHLLKPYLMKRDDYTSAGIEKIVSSSLLHNRTFECIGTANNRCNSFRRNYHDESFG